MMEGIFSKEDEEMIKRGMEIHQKEMNEQIGKDEAILMEAKSLLNEDMVKILDEQIEESGYCTEFEFVNKPEGDDQKEDYEFYVNQTCNGGYTGDMFSGFCYFKISENKWLKWYYDM